MCGRFIIFSEAEEKEIMDIVEEVNRKYVEDAMKDGEIFPTDLSPTISLNNDIKDISLFKWGFPNFKGSSVIINARSENLLEKPIFRESFLSRRCLIPATAFFEWKKEGFKKQKFIISSSEVNLFYMAGLYKETIDKNGDKVTSFVIITTAASSNMSKIHDRMPVMLVHKSETELWLKTESNIRELNYLFNPNNKINMVPV